MAHCEGEAQAGKPQVVTGQYCLINIWRNSCSEMTFRDGGNISKTSRFQDAFPEVEGILFDGVFVNRLSDLCRKCLASDYLRVK